MKDELNKQEQYSRLEMCRITPQKRQNTNNITAKMDKHVTPSNMHESILVS